MSVIENFREETPIDEDEHVQNIFTWIFLTVLAAPQNLVF
jgi:hypothetical protein